jgi:hypothetical protein
VTGNAASELVDTSIRFVFGQTLNLAFRGYSGCSAPLVSSVDVSDVEGTRVECGDQSFRDTSVQRDSTPGIKAKMCANLLTSHLGVIYHCAGLKTLCALKQV